MQKDTSRGASQSLSDSHRLTRDGWRIEEAPDDGWMGGGMDGDGLEVRMEGERKRREASDELATSEQEALLSFLVNFFGYPKHLSRLSLALAASRRLEAGKAPVCPVPAPSSTPLN